MHVPSPTIERLLPDAVELRAAGKSWEFIAAKLGRSPKTLRGWRMRFRAEWEILYQLAECDQKREGDAESIAAMRQQLRKEQAKGQREAAKQLMTSADNYRRFAKANSASQPAKSPK